MCCMLCFRSCFFFFNDTATTEIYTLSLHDALPILMFVKVVASESRFGDRADANPDIRQDRKSTRLNSSHLGISYAVFCLKKKKRCCATRPMKYNDVCSPPCNNALKTRNSTGTSDAS